MYRHAGQASSLRREVPPFGSELMGAGLIYGGALVLVHMHIHAHVRPNPWAPGGIQIREQAGTGPFGAGESWLAAKLCLSGGAAFKMRKVHSRRNTFQCYPGPPSSPPDASLLELPNPPQASHCAWHPRLATGRYHLNQLAFTSSHHDASAWAQPGGITVVPTPSHVGIVLAMVSYAGLLKVESH